VRWITISHDDADHVGNLDVVLELCPNATLVSSWFITERMSVELAPPPTRMRWLVDGDTLDIGDRTLQLVRPPIFDSPVTRGVFDPTTGVYWAADAFATPMSTYVDNVRELDHAFWTHGFAMFAQAVSPWIEMVEPAKFAGQVERIANLQPGVIAGCHTPTIEIDRVGAALELMRNVLDVPQIPLPDQAVLDEIIASMMTGEVVA
jgi:flavorubredoxin